MTSTGSHFVKLALADGGTTSEAVDVRAFRRFAILIPADFTGAMLLVSGSVDGATFYQTDVALAVSATEQWVTLSSDQAEALSPLPWLRFVSDVAQTPATSLFIALKG